MSYPRCMIYFLVFSYVCSCTTGRGKTSVSGPNDHQPMDVSDSAFKWLDIEKQNDFYEQKFNIKVKDKYRKPIIILIADTLRPDYIDEDNAPVLHRFQQENRLAAWSASGATSSAHALFTLFYGMLPHQRYMLINDEWVNRANPDWRNSRAYLRGSPYLHLFRTLGMPINIYSWPDIDFCYKVDRWKPLQTPQLVHLNILYSKDTMAFFNKCPSYLKVQNKLENAGIIDHEVFEKFRRDYAHSKPMDLPSLSIIRIQGAHHPYGWVSKRKMHQDYLMTHNFEWNLPAKTTWYSRKQDEQDWENIRNSYRNAVRSVDYQLWNLIKFLKDKNFYDETTLVVMSDHGHALMDINDKTYGEWNGHGFLPYKNLARNVISIKWPASIEKEIKEGLVDNAQFSMSIADVFPTILAGMDLDTSTYFDDLPVIGQSQFDKKGSCEVTFKSEYDMPIDTKPPSYLSEFSFDNGEERIFFRFERRSNIFASKKIYVTRVLDRNDRDVAFEADKIKSKILAEYSLCLTKIFAAGDFESYVDVKQSM